MIELDFCKKSPITRKEIVEDFRKKNLAGRQNGKINSIEEWCIKYLNDVDGKHYDFNTIIEALPGELIKIKNYLDKTYDVDKIMDELPHGEKYCYIETSLYTKMKNDAKKLLLNSLNVIVCPYCNRNYVFADENVNTCELDHFIPKRKYPIFASSFYNLIPSCPYCNGKKGENNFEIFPHAHKKNTDELIKFTYNILGGDYLTNVDDLDIELCILDREYQKQAEILELEKLYKHHKDIVQDVLKKRQIFSDSYLAGLSKEFGTLFETQVDVEELIYGISLKTNDYGKRPLTKIIKDIVREVNSKK